MIQEVNILHKAWGNYCGLLQTLGVYELFLNLNFKVVVYTCLCVCFSYVLIANWILEIGILRLMKGYASEIFKISPIDRKSTRLNSSHSGESRMPSSA